MNKFMKKVSNFLLGKEMADMNVNDKQQIKGKAQEVEISGSKEKEKMRTKNEPSELKNKGRLFVGGLNRQTTSQGLSAYFSQFGKVLDAVVMRFPQTNKSRGFGFVLFVEPSDAEAALRSDEHVLDGRKIDVRPFVPSGEAAAKKETDHKVFLGGLSETTTSDVLEKFFGRYGEISRIVIPLNRNTKKPKGFGFIYFKGEDAVEKCLREDFVHLGGRRVHIKRPEPRNSSHAREGSDAAPDCQEADESSLEDCVAWGEETTSVGVDNDAVSGEELENYLQLRKLFEDSFVGKLANLCEMNERQMKTGEENRNFEELLGDFLVRHSEEWSTSRENLMSFSDDSKSDSSAVPDSDSDSVDSDGDHGADNDTDALDDFSAKFMQMLTGGPLPRDEEMSNSRFVVSGDSQTSIPFKVKDSSGSLFCSLCRWTPPGNSSESFLVHCKSPAHRAKLKDRFPKEQSQPDRDTDSGKEAAKTDSKAKPAPQNPVAGTKQKKSKSQNTIQPQENAEKTCKTAQAQKKAPAGKPAGTKAVAKGGDVETKNANTNPKPNENKNQDKSKDQSSKSAKMTALARGMSCIQPMHGAQLKCNMCNKIIPKADDISVLMKNVWHHLQSKGHLKRLLKTENSLRESMQKSEEKIKNDNARKESKAPAQKQKAGARENQVAKGNETKKSQNKSSESKALFLCVPCNFFNKDMEVFKAHLKSKSHLDCFVSKGVSTDFSLDNLSKCKSCQLFLYGSLFYINKHYSKCSAKEG